MDAMDGSNWRYRLYGRLRRLDDLSGILASCVGR